MISGKWQSRKLQESVPPAKYWTGRTIWSNYFGTLSLTEHLQHTGESLMRMLINFSKFWSDSAFTLYQLSSSIPHPVRSSCQIVGIPSAVCWSQEGQWAFCPPKRRVVRFDCWLLLWSLNTWKKVQPLFHSTLEPLEELGVRHLKKPLSSQWLTAETKRNLSYSPTTRNTHFAK